MRAQSAACNHVNFPTDSNTEGPATCPHRTAITVQGGTLYLGCAKVRSGHLSHDGRILRTKDKSLSKRATRKRIFFRHLSRPGVNNTPKITTRRQSRPWVRTWIRERATSHTVNPRPGTFGWLWLGAGLGTRVRIRVQGLFFLRTHFGHVH